MSPDGAQTPAARIPSIEELRELLPHLTPEERAELHTLIDEDLMRTPVRPQDGPQAMFVDHTADIVIYGGSAGSGKTFGLLYKPLSDLRNVPGFMAVMFRRTKEQLRKPGANWDESMGLYPQFGGHPVSQVMEWHFQGGGKLKMDGLEHDASVLDWHSAQVAALLFDELTLFSRHQFFYMLSRNRSTCGVKPYVRAGCNPDADSWVAEFIAWWIDQDTGFPIPERAGVVRYFVRDGDALVWGDASEELVERFGPDSEPKSVTFIPAKITDNRILLAKDPGYLANLKALPHVERQRLLAGNWKIRPAAGLLFQRAWCKVIDVEPLDLELIRGWDLAGTPKNGTNDPDATASVRLGRRPTGSFVVCHASRHHEAPRGVRSAIENTATSDGAACRVALPQDPGQAGKDQVGQLVLMLAGYRVESSPESGDKTVRFGGFSAQAEAGNVEVVRGPWNEDWFAELEGFPDAKHDDYPDATSRAFNTLVGPIARPRLRSL